MQLCKRRYMHMGKFLQGRNFFFFMSLKKKVEPPFDQT